MKFPIALLCLCAVTLAQADEPAFQPIFDGKTLDGWKAPDMSYWSIQDGAITAISSEDHPCKKNQFLVWQGGDIANFELKLQFRVVGGPKANSGIQVRSQVQEDGHAVGYQADISQPDGEWLGAIYDEHGRKTLAKRNHSTVINEDGTMDSEVFLASDEEDYAAGINIEEWHEYAVTFVDNKMTVKIDGKLMSQIEDNQESEREMSGILALQLHSGPPMKVQFKDVMLKQLP